MYCCHTCLYMYAHTHVRVSCRFALLAFGKDSAPPCPVNGYRLDHLSSAKSKLLLRVLIASSPKLTVQMLRPLQYAEEPSRGFPQPQLALRALPQP